jgi:hypothetical protein
MDSGESGRRPRAARRSRTGGSSHSLQRRRTHADLRRL